MMTFFYVKDNEVKYVKGVSFKDALNKTKFINNQSFIRLYPDIKVACFNYTTRLDMVSGEEITKNYLVFYSSVKQLFFKKNKLPRYNIDSEMEFYKTIFSGVSFGKFIKDNKLNPNNYLKYFELEYKEEL